MTETTTAPPPPTATKPVEAPTNTRRVAQPGAKLRLFTSIDGEPSDCVVEHAQSTREEIERGVPQRVTVRPVGDDGSLGQPVVGVSVFDPLTPERRAAFAAKHPGATRFVWVEFES